MAPRRSAARAALAARLGVPPVPVVPGVEEEGVAPGPRDAQDLHKGSVGVRRVCHETVRRVLRFRLCLVRSLPTVQTGPYDATNVWLGVTPSGPLVVAHTEHMDGGRRALPYAPH